MSTPALKLCNLDRVSIGIFGARIGAAILSKFMLENLFSYTQDIFQCIASIIQILSLWRFPPVVKSEHVVIILHIIFVEQHIDLGKINLKSIVHSFY